MRQRKNLTDSSVSELSVLASKYEVRDSKLPGLCVRVEGSGRKTFYFVYSVRGRVRWYRIGPAEMGAAEARKVARELIGDVARGRDPHAERMTERGGATFERLHTRYLEEHAKKRNKSWRQAEFLIKKYVLPKLGNLSAREINRSQVKQLLGRLSIDRPILANQVRYAIGAVFTFGMKADVLTVNPCAGVEDNPTTERDRTLSATEVPIFWAACESIHPIKAAALKLVLLTGQRPGEVSQMRSEHIKGQWWEMPGKPVPDQKWPGTKNGRFHRVFLTEQVQELIGSDAQAGFVFANERGNAIDGLEGAMREISRLCSFDPTVRPHDLRRTMGTTVTGRGHGREAMDRLLNHRKKRSVTDVYDRFDYARDDERIMRDVSAHLMRLVEVRVGDENNVIAGEFRKAQ